MASLALGVVGAGIGFYFGGPTGAKVGFLVGSYLGGKLEGGPHTEGPRINDKSVQASTYGIPIPIVYGTVRVAGNIIWAAELREVPVESGGKGGSSGTATTYSYYGTFAVSLCANEITAIRKIWADGKLIYDASDGNSGPLGISASQAFFEAVNIDDVALPLTVYRGSETQLPDPTMEAYLGVGNVPAYRGQAYVVFTDYPLERFGNRIPNLSFEVVAVGTVYDPVTVYTEPAGMRPSAVYNPILNEVWMQMEQVSATDPYLVRLNADTGAVEGYIAGNVLHRQFSPHTVTFGAPIFDSQSGSVYFVDSDKNWVRIDAASGVEIGCFDHSGDWSVAYYGPVLNALRGELWLVDGGFHNLALANKYTGDILRTVPLGIYFQNMVFDDWQGAGWIIGFSPGNPDVQKNLYKLNETGTAVELAHTFAASVINITYDTLRNAVLLSDTVTTTVYRYDVDLQAPATPATVTITQPPPTESGTFIYDPQRDLIEVVHYAPLVNTFTADFAVDGENYKTITPAYLSTFIMPGKNAILMIGGGPSGLTDKSLVKIRFDVVTSESVPLADIVTDLRVRAGLQESDIDVSELLDQVLGYAVTRQGACRDNVLQLATGFLFDGVESDDIIKFPKRGRLPAVTIPAEECAAHAPGGQPPDVLTKTRAQDIELPQRLNVVYNAVALDYAQGNQLSERLAGATPTSAQMMAFESPIVMTDNYARALADVLMFNAWTERTRYQFATSLKYAVYEPTDVVTVVDRVLRITRKNEAAGEIRFEGVHDDLAIYSQDAQGVSAIRPPQEIDALVLSFFLPIDCALLRDVDNAPGFYAAVGGYLEGWDGAVLYKSFDGGGSYVPLQAFTNPPAAGVAVEALGDFAGGNVFDELNSLRVSLWADGTLSSSTRAAVLNGANAAALKSGEYWEIVQFRTATLNADGTYTLTGLLRGRLGSEYAMAGHAPGDAFVLLSVPTLGNIAMAVAEIDAERLYKPVSIGDTLANTAAQAFAAQCVRLMPLAPVHVGGGRNAAGDVLGHWRRRSRLGWGWHNGADIVLGEDSEIYEVEIYDSTYTTLVCSFTGLTTPAFTYTAAEQTTDFGGLQSIVYGKVYQISATVGRGFPATFAI